MPLSESEVRAAFMLIERLSWELADAKIAELAGLGVTRRRIWLIHEVTGPWLYDVIEGDGEIVGLGPEAVWATSASSIDHWIASRNMRTYPGDLALLPEQPPALDVRFDGSGAVGGLALGRTARFD